MGSNFCMGFGIIIPSSQIIKSTYGVPKRGHPRFPHGSGRSSNQVWMTLQIFRNFGLTLQHLQHFPCYILLASGNPSRKSSAEFPGYSWASWVACGSYHAFAVCEGQLYSWGRMEGGQLGLASEVIEGHIEESGALVQPDERRVGMCGMFDSFFCFSCSFRSCCRQVMIGIQYIG